MSTFTQDPDSVGTNVLSIALIGPEEQRRKAIAAALANSQANVTRELAAYPELDDVQRLLAADYDVIIVELDSNPEHALDIVEHICGHSPVTVMVYSAQTDPELLVRCMRAGAREFLNDPVAAGTIAEALVRASVRKPVPREPKKQAGKLIVFAGAKGGSGVTTLASNFAVALAQESGANTLLIDLNLPLGNAALDLGISAPFSTVSALESSNRLDGNFLATLLSKHSSGLSVLAAPDRYTPSTGSEEAVEKLLAVSRQSFEYVVVDAGSSSGTPANSLFSIASAVYLVAQVNIPELRNANRIIAEFFSGSRGHLEVVLNRYTPRTLGIDEESIVKALTVPVKWKVPSDFPAVQRAQNTATALALEDSQISREVRKMARVAAGMSAVPEKRKKYSLFG